ncbi:MAG: nuclear transport factor 2 family protein, partial [Pseudomonadales bacterium]|nr:nuclear transport factor 2 family protein [Pseudomonadales bacterium]
GNFRIAFSSDIKAKCHCYVRASHAGKGESNACFYEVWAEYQDELEYRNDQWLIARRTMSVIQEVGQRAILGPES